MVLIDTNNRPIGTTKNDPPPLNSPDREFLRVLRLLETALRSGVAETCDQLQACHEGGWGITLDPAIPESQAEAVSIMRMRRDANNHLVYVPERWLGLGAGFAEALDLVKSHQQ